MSGGDYCYCVRVYPPDFLVPTVDQALVKELLLSPIKQCLGQREGGGSLQWPDRGWRGEEEFVKEVTKAFSTRSSIEDGAWVARNQTAQEAAHLVSNLMTVQIRAEVVQTTSPALYAVTTAPPTRRNKSGGGGNSNNDGSDSEGEDDSEALQQPEALPVMLSPGATVNPADTIFSVIITLPASAPPAGTPACKSFVDQYYSSDGGNMASQLSTILGNKSNNQQQIRHLPSGSYTWDARGWDTRKHFKQHTSFQLAKYGRCVYARRQNFTECRILKARLAAIGVDATIQVVGGRDYLAVVPDESEADTVWNQEDESGSERGGCDRRRELERHLRRGLPGLEEMLRDMPDELRARLEGGKKKKETTTLKSFRQSLPVIKYAKPSSSPRDNRAALSRTNSLDVAGPAATSASGSATHSNVICTECIFCCEDFVEGEEVTCLPCGHHFHRGTEASHSLIGGAETEQEDEKCHGVLGWIKDHNDCPICRATLPTEEKETASSDKWTCPLCDTELDSTFTCAPCGVRRNVLYTAERDTTVALFEAAEELFMRCHAQPPVPVAKEGEGEGEGEAAKARKVRDKLEKDIAKVVDGPNMSDLMKNNWNIKDLVKSMLNKALQGEREVSFDAAGIDSNSVALFTILLNRIRKRAAGAGGAAGEGPPTSPFEMRVQMHRNGDSGSASAGNWTCPLCATACSGGDCQTCGVNSNVMGASKSSARSIFETAEDLFTRCLARDPGDDRAHLQLWTEMGALFKQRDFEAALAHGWAFRHGLRKILVGALEKSPRVVVQSRHMDLGSCALLATFINKVKDRGMELTLVLPPVPKTRWTCPLCSKAQVSMRTTECECGVEHKIFPLSNSATCDVFDEIEEVFMACVQGHGSKVKLRADIDALFKPKSALEGLQSSGWAIKDGVRALLNEALSGREEIKFMPGLLADPNSKGLFAILVNRLRDRLEELPPPGVATRLQPPVATSSAQPVSVSSSRFPVKAHSRAFIRAHAALFTTIAKMVAAQGGSNESWATLENVVLAKFEKDNWKIAKAIKMMRDERCRDILQLTSGIDSNSGLIIEFILQLVDRFESEFAADPGAVASAVLEADLTVASIGSGAVGRQHGSDDSDDSEGDSQEQRLRRMLRAAGDGQDGSVNLLRTMLTERHGADVVEAMGDLSVINEALNSMIHEAVLSGQEPDADAMRDVLESAVEAGIAKAARRASASASASRSAPSRPDPPSMIAISGSGVPAVNGLYVGSTPFGSRGLSKVYVKQGEAEGEPDIEVKIMNFGGRKWWSIGDGVTEFYLHKSASGDDAASPPLQGWEVGSGGTLPLPAFKADP